MSQVTGRSRISASGRILAASWTACLRFATTTVNAPLTRGNSMRQPAPRCGRTIMFIVGHAVRMLRLRRHIRLGESILTRKRWSECFICEHGPNCRPCAAPRQAFSQPSARSQPLPQTPPCASSQLRDGQWHNPQRRRLLHVCRQRDQRHRLLPHLLGNLLRLHAWTSLPREQPKLSRRTCAR
jgi:hypothetical protein